MSKFCKTLQEISSINKAIDLLDRALALDDLPFVEDFYGLKNELEVVKLRDIEKVENSR